MNRRSAMSALMKVISAAAITKTAFGQTDILSGRRKSELKQSACRFVVFGKLGKDVIDVRNPYEYAFNSNITLDAVSYDDLDFMRLEDTLNFIVVSSEEQGSLDSASHLARSIISHGGKYVVLLARKFTGIHDSKLPAVNALVSRSQAVIDYPLFYDNDSEFGEVVYKTVLKDIADTINIISHSFDENHELRDFFGHMVDDANYLRVSSIGANKQCFQSIDYHIDRIHECDYRQEPNMFWLVGGQGQAQTVLAEIAMRNRGDIKSRERLSVELMSYTKQSVMSSQMVLFSSCKSDSVLSDLCDAGHLYIRREFIT